MLSGMLYCTTGSVEGASGSLSAQGTTRRVGSSAKAHFQQHFGTVPSRRMGGKKL